MKEVKETLSEGQYLIPDGYKATVANGVVEISIKRDNHIKEGEYRCKDCIHRVQGHSTANFLRAWVCELKPKTSRNPISATQKLFYSAPLYGKICEHFQKKGGKQ